MYLFFGIMLIATAALEAGEPTRTGFVRGVILESHSGEVSVRAAPGDVYQFIFDSRTWIEREHQRVSGATLRPGETLEIVSDRGGQAPQYARLIHVMDLSVVRPPVREGQFRLYRRQSERIESAELVVYTGVVVKLDGPLVIRTRFDGLKTIYLRADTRCLKGGIEVPAASLLPQTHVFVTAGKNADAEFEAYQIIWGELLQPELNR